VLVFEPTNGGLLTLLAHSAASDLAQLSATVRVAVATTTEQGTAALAAEPFRCVVVDLGTPAAIEFLDQVREQPRLRDVPALALLPSEHGTGGQPAAAHQARGNKASGNGASQNGAAKNGSDLPERLAALRTGYPALELLPSLDDLRERITLHLSAARPGRVPALVGEAAAARATGTPAANGSAPPDAPDAHPGLRGKHVLVIDDDPRNVFALSSTLELHGVRVTHANDGKAGIDALRSAPDTNLILMDVMMPGMDGYATMTAIRKMRQFKKLPIIAVTARAMPGDREKSIAAGASDYVTKPVDTEELLLAMERWLTRS
jgi:CheY-like chemotaxis protein